MPERREPEAGGITSLWETRGAGGLLIGVWFSYQGRELEAQLDEGRHEWHVRMGGQDIARVDLGAQETAETVARVIVDMFFSDRPTDHPTA